MFWLRHLLGFVQVNLKSARKASDVRLLFHALINVYYRCYVCVYVMYNLHHGIPSYLVFLKKML